MNIKTSPSSSEPLHLVDPFDLSVAAVPSSSTEPAREVVPTPPDRLLDELRREIDSVDTGLVALLRWRARVASRIGEVKRGLGVPTRDEQRERAVMERFVALSDPEVPRDHWIQICRAIVTACRSIQ